MIFVFEKTFHFFVIMMFFPQTKCLENSRHTVIALKIIRFFLICLANVTLNPLIKFLNKEGRETLSLDRD